MGGFSAPRAGEPQYLGSFPPRFSFSCRRPRLPGTALGSSRLDPVRSLLAHRRWPGEPFSLGGVGTFASRLAVLALLHLCVQRSHALNPPRLSWRSVAPPPVGGRRVGGVAAWCSHRGFWASGSSSFA